MLPSTQNKMKAVDSVFYDSFMRLQTQELEEKEDIIDDEIKRFYNDDLEESNFGEVFNEKYYEYPGLKLLNTTDLQPEPFNTKIHICAFHINMSGTIPFLEYFFRKNKKNDQINADKFVFPSFTYEGDIDPLIRAETIMELLMYAYKCPTSFLYEGFLQDDTHSNYYLFFNCSNEEIGVHDLYRDNEMWLLTMDEILNTKEVCGNFFVDQEVTQFFEENPDFIYLKNKYNKNYEVPVIAYIGTTATKSSYISIFGNGKSDEKSIFGSNYYFYDYNTSAKMAIDEENSRKNTNTTSVKPVTIMNWLNSTEMEGCSIIRFALFMGKTHVITNCSKDPSDSSETTHEMLKEDSTCATLSHRQLINYLRISDRGSSWTEEYDSVFLGKGVELDDDTVMNHSNTYVTKNYEQQIPLSCHFLESVENNVYFIK
jgi:hypothetical protein